MMVSHVKIIAFQTITNRSFCTFYIGEKPVVYIISIGNYTVREVLMKNRTSVWRNVYNTASA